MTNSIRNAFNKISNEYDLQRKKLIPCFDDFYNMAVSVVNTPIEAPNVLDIGAGTGLLSSFILDKFPRVKLTLIDISEGMLEVAKGRFQNNSNVQYLVGDFTKFDFQDSYDIIVSALSIHHLTDEQKEELYKKCYGLLRPQGYFVNAEQILGSTTNMQKFYMAEWKKYIESTDLPKDKIAAGYQRMNLDKEATVEIQLKWLRDIGFADVDCIYKYNNFAVLTGRKI